MLTAEDNTMLTRVGAGTPMGELMRRFWIPALLSHEIAEPDSAPVRVVLLGERLVAFRDSNGRVGLLDEQCPHRRASLALGANERCGLRCLYHGWKFDVDGNCVDTPAEPVNSSLKDRVKAKAYPTIDKGGVVWTYMGPADSRPPFPEYEWLNLPPGHCQAFKIQEDCNYAQAVEGTIDTAHAGVLHRSVRWDDESPFPHEQVLQTGLEVEYTKYGMRYAGLRKLADGSTYTRITITPMPFLTMIPPDTTHPVRATRRMANAFVPRDDTSTWHVQWFFDQTQPVDREFRIKEGGLQLHDDYRKKVNIDNWYGQDRKMMKEKNFSGITGIVIQDHAVVETQGRIVDRTTEHLGTTDVAVVAWRRQMLRAAKALAANGERPAMLTDPTIPWSSIHATELVLPPGKDWKDAVPLDQRCAG
jgi:phenylpropionate dioxygenase-like ring-hydroxylating dioxygenase large terminal subunit